MPLYKVGDKVVVFNVNDKHTSYKPPAKTFIGFISEIESVIEYKISRENAYHIRNCPYVWLESELNFAAEPIIEENDLLNCFN